MSKNRIRLVHVITSLGHGGAQAMLVKLLPALSQRFDVHVISLMDDGIHGDSVRKYGVTLHCLNSLRVVGAPFVFFRLRKLIRDLQPDVIQAWMYHANLAVNISCGLMRHKSRVAWNIRHSLSDLSHEKLLTRLVILGNRLFSKAPAKIVYNSQVSKIQHEQVGYSEEHSLVIPNGIDLERFSSSEEVRTRMRSELGISKDSIVVGHAARFHPMKDHHGFLTAAVQVAENYSNVCFILCGIDVSIDNPTLVEMIPEELRCRFLLLGARDDIPALMNAFDIFCLSSAWGEAWPNVLGEAMAMGIPCVSTDVGDSKAIVEDTGIVVPASDVSALIQALEKIVTLPEHELNALGGRARARIHDNFTMDRISKEYIKLYNNLDGNASGLN
jgi:glycosyltransferase involved in cell wall biosynthesis